jgi:hypothetical protein
VRAEALVGLEPELEPGTESEPGSERDRSGIGPEIGNWRGLSCAAGCPILGA